MKQFEKVLNTLKGLTSAITRFPLSAAFLLTAAVTNAMDIQAEDRDYIKYLLALLVGAFLGAAGQMIYERFFRRAASRMGLLGFAALMTLGYYLIIAPAPGVSMEMSIRTAVALFAVLIAFIWIPSIRNRITFNESFMVAFKAFFIALFFSGVLFAGTSIIIGAIDQLLFEVDHKAYSHAANIIFTLFAPIYFLSLIPEYPVGRHENEDHESVSIKEEKVEKMAGCPKYLEILISYIIIPLVAVFTVILAIYTGINIGREFWTDNLLEPMIVSYSITVILVYILASRLENKFAVWFRKVFPKVLVPIVIFQTVASSIRIGESGVTHTRYFVILFGIFAIASGVIFSIVPVRKNGIIAAILIVLSFISIVPPTDAFTISRNNQIGLLESILIKNNMLSENTIKPNPSVPDEDKKKIRSSFEYLGMMEYTGKVAWLPEGFDYYRDFQRVFGFTLYGFEEEPVRFINVRLDESSMIDIAGYDAFAYTNVYISANNTANESIGTVSKSGRTYLLNKNLTGSDGVISLVDDSGREYISFPLKEIFDRFEDYSNEKALISMDEARFSRESENAAITIVIQNLHMDKSAGNEYYGADLYVFVKIK